MINAHIDYRTGTVTLQFRYHPKTVETLKTIPGSKWDPQAKIWRCGLHSWGVLKPLLHHRVTSTVDEVPIHKHFLDRLRPYQIEGAQWLVKNRRGFLAYAPRVGKTCTSIAAASALIEHERAGAVLVLYPAGVRNEWRRQLKQWANCDLLPIEEMDRPLIGSEIAKLRARPWSFFGCAWTSVRECEVEIGRIFNNRPYIIIADEVHLAQNAKAKRAQSLKRIVTGTPLIKAPVDEFSPETAEYGHCPPVAIWGMSGTLMRNRPENMFGLFEFVFPGWLSWGKYVARYCGGEILEHGTHWEYEPVLDDDGKPVKDSKGRPVTQAVQLPGHRNTKGESNLEELGQRIDAVTLRKTRAEVAQWLPPCEDVLIACAVPEGFLKRYKKLEAGMAKADLESDAQGARDAVKALAMATMAEKIPTAIQRAIFHLERGVKVIVSAYFHESLKALDVAIQKAKLLFPCYRAGGWETPAARAQKIEAWKGVPGPALLICNVLSSGIGIDLADAEVSILLEPVWVPADLQQFRDRIVDVHLGKATTPRIYETLVVAQTVDTDMLGAVLRKIRGINAVGLGDPELSKIAASIRDSGVVETQNMSLESTDEGAVNAAIAGLIARWSSEDGEPGDSLVSELVSLEDDEVSSDD